MTHRYLLEHLAVDVIKMVLTLLIVGATAVVITALVTGWDIHALAEYSNGAVRLSLSPDYEKEK